MKRYGQTTRGVQTGDYTYSIVPNMQEDALGNWVSYSDHEAALKAAVAAEREAIAQMISHYQVPVGNSSAGEMACEWTMDALSYIVATIRARGAA